MHSAELGSEHNAQPPVMQVAYARPMAISSLRHLRRKANLDRLVQEFGGATALALLIDTPKSHISALQKGSRGIGDKLAAKLERKCEKPDGWMDQQHEGEVLHKPSGLSVIVDDEMDTAFGVGRLHREDMELLRDLMRMHDHEREAFMAAIRVRSSASSRGSAPSKTGLTMGVTALLLADAAKDLADRTRGHIAHLAGEMIENGPDESQASAIDALATVDVLLPSGALPKLRNEHPLMGVLLDLDQDVLEAVRHIAQLSQTMNVPQRRAMVAALSGAEETSWDMTDEGSRKFLDRERHASFEPRSPSKKSKKAAGS